LATTLPSADPAASRIALVTLTTDAFVPATLVCLHSFVETNPWFDGEVIILHAGLAPRWQDVLQRGFDRVRLMDVSDDLASRVQRYLEHRPDLADLRTRFFCLDLFRLRGYDRVLFCDGDVLFRGDVRDLLESDAPLLACGECLYYAGRGRDRRTLEERALGESADVLSHTFNSGLLSLDGSLFTDDEQARVLEWLDPRHAPAPSVRMSFQAVVNLHFAGRQRLASGRFNYLVRCWRLIETREHVALRDARVLHFAGPLKPWDAGRVLSAGLSDPVIARAAHLWQEAFARALGRVHLRCRTDTL
jgi:lipopolysaccharide biosynthesis glycosyltransferase